MEFLSLMTPAQSDALRFSASAEGPTARDDREMEKIRPARSFRECLEEERKTATKTRNGESVEREKPVLNAKKTESAGTVRAGESGTERIRAKDDSGERTAEKKKSSRTGEEKDPKVAAEPLEAKEPEELKEAQKPKTSGSMAAVKESAEVSAKERLDREKEGLIAEIVGLLEESGDVGFTAASPDALRELSAQLKSFDAETLKSLLDEMKKSDRPLETLKTVFAGLKGRLPAGFEAESSGGLALSSREAFSLEREGTEERVLVNKSRVSVEDHRSGKGESDQNSSGGKGSQAVEKAVQPEALSEGVRKPSGETKGFDEWLGRDQAVRTQSSGVEARPQAMELNRTNQTFNDLVRQARLMLEDKKTMMQFEMRPEHLGRVTLKIEMINDRIMASLTAHNENAGEMLRQNMGDLYQAFREAGFDETRLDVNVGNGESGSSGGEDAAESGLSFAVEDAVFEPAAFAFAAESLSSGMTRIDALA